MRDSVAGGAQSLNMAGEASRPLWTLGLLVFVAFIVYIGEMDEALARDARATMHEGGPARPAAAAGADAAAGGPAGVVKPRPGKRAYPAHWGEPPLMQTRDLRELPGGYGMGSGTLAKWIREHMEQDERDGTPAAAAATAEEGK